MCLQQVAFKGCCNLEIFVIRSLKKEEQTEFKVDMGRQKDAWMELYGNSVLNNTLQVSPSELEGFPRLIFFLHE